MGGGGEEETEMGERKGEREGKRGERERGRRFGRSKATAPSSAIPISQYRATELGRRCSTRVHPDLGTTLQGLEAKFSHVKYGNYRVALKVRGLQKRLQRKTHTHHTHTHSHTHTHTHARTHAHTHTHTTHHAPVCLSYASHEQYTW